MKIRKAIIQIMAAVLSLALLAACGSIPTPVRGQRHVLGDPCRKYATQAVAIYDKYLDFEITREQAIKEMTDLWERASYLDGSYELMSVEHNFLFKLEFAHLDFSAFRDYSDNELRGKRDEIDRMIENLQIGPNDYICQNADGVRAIGFDPLDVAEYTQPSPDQDAHVMTVLRTPTFDANRFRDSLASVIAKIASGETEPLVIEIYDGAVDYNYRVGRAHFGSYEGTRDDVEFVTNFLVTADEAKYAYLFGLSDNEVEVYQKNETSSMGYDEVFSQPDPLAPEEAADFFLACLPE